MIELKDLTIEDINLEYEKEFGKGNFENRDDYQFTIKIAKDFPCFKITKDAPSWIIADIYEFVYDIFSNYDFKEAIDNKDDELIRFLDYLEELVNQEKHSVYSEIFEIWDMQTLSKEYMAKITNLFKPLTLQAWNKYKESGT